MESLEESVAVNQRDIAVIRRREKGSAANKSEGRSKAKMRRQRLRVANGRAALMVEELYGEAGIDGGLIWIVGWSIHLIEAEAAKQRGLIGKDWMDTRGEVDGVADHLGQL